MGCLRIIITYSRSKLAQIIYCRRRRRRRRQRRQEDDHLYTTAICRITTNHIDFRLHCYRCAASNWIGPIRCFRKILLLTYKKTLVIVGWVE